MGRDEAQDKRQKSYKDIVASNSKVEARVGDTITMVEWNPSNKVSSIEVDIDEEEVSWLRHNAMGRLRSAFYYSHVQSMLFMEGVTIKPYSMDKDDRKYILWVKIEELPMYLWHKKNV
ncbi:hypothetical protein QQP08_004880 [Theobroma cacao]|nr:hypothetical protein QQP08_004880 [Theobroma cacao]